jgi:hypothetical protein
VGRFFYNRDFEEFYTMYLFESLIKPMDPLSDIYYQLSITLFRRKTVLHTTQYILVSISWGVKILDSGIY